MGRTSAAEMATMTDSWVRNHPEERSIAVLADMAPPT